MNKSKCPVCGSNHTKKNGKDGYSVFSEEMPIVEDIEAEKTKLESVTYDSKSMCYYKKFFR